MQTALALPVVVVDAEVCVDGIGAGVIVEVFACDLRGEDDVADVVAVPVVVDVDPPSFQFCTP
ncbi:MAG: hypothetical protein ABI132_01080 [Rhodanobacteraceae bacterium]